MANIFTYNEPFTLESGVQLPGYHLSYTTYGDLNESKDNVAWIFHALTANSDAVEWWPGLTGEGKLFDPSKYFIVCVNMPGSCYGSIGPLENIPGEENPWFHQFPFFTTRDMIRSYQPLRASLGIRTIEIGVGGSMGGQQLLEWAIEEPGIFSHIILMATNAVHSPWGIAFNATQRHAIETDPSWQEAHKDAGMNGMMVARQVALLSYRNYNTYATGQGEDNNEKTANFKSESYQQYQGVKLARRFNAFSYYCLSRSMDAHNVGRSRGGVENALQQVKAKTLVISISSDILFPPKEQAFMAKQIPGAVYKAIDSMFGHDGFLLEYEQIGNAILRFLDNQLNDETPAKVVDILTIV